jgi:hypothetical protein
MAANAIKMLSDPILHEKMKANALKRAQDFDIIKILPLYEKFYERITSKSWKFPKQND